MGTVKQKGLIDLDRDKLKMYLNINHIYYNALSRQMGHSDHYITHWIHNHMSVKRKEYEKMIDILQVPFDYFLKESDKKTNTKIKNKDKGQEIINIDYDKLANHLKKFSITRTDLSISMGKGHSFITDLIVHERPIKEKNYLLVNTLNVDYDCFIKKDVKVKVSKQDKPITEPDKDIKEEEQYSYSEVNDALQRLHCLELLDEDIKNGILRLNSKEKKILDKINPIDFNDFNEKLNNIDLSLRNIGNLLVQINEKLK